MAGREIIVPDFDFSGTYYADIIEALLEYKRKNIPEISNENPFETGVQLLRSFALVGHLNNVLLDLTAQETYLPSAQVRDNIVRILALIGFVPNANIPAITTLRAQLTRGFSTSTLIVPDNALFGTKRRASTPSLLFEADEAITVSATDVLDACWLLTEAGVWTDYTTEVNGIGSPNAGATVGRALYFAHDSVFTDRLVLDGLSSFDPGDHRTGSPVAIHYQFFDGELEDATPDNVIVGASTLKLYINGLTGTNEDGSYLTKVGDYVTVTVNATGANERCAVQFDIGGNYIETSDFLGQTTVSYDLNEYTVGTYWHDVDLATDGTAATAVETENYATGNGVDTTFSAILSRYPLEDDTIVTWNYLSGGLPKTATFDLSDNSLGGDANIGTLVIAVIGDATLEASSVPDVGTITVTYSRKSATGRQSGALTWLPPFNAEQSWVKAQLPEIIRGSTGPTLEGYWFRILFSSFGAGTPTSYTFDGASWDQGGMYIRIPVTQGQTASETLGSGDGTASQTFTASESPVIQDSVQLFVDGEEWTQVEDFFASTDVDEHFTVAIDSDGIATILTGDGENGRIVPTGTNNVTATYRTGAENDGNVGAGQIEVSRSGLSRVKNITNPLAAVGWTAQEGSDSFGLEKLKRDGVSSLRALRRAVSPSDVEYLTGRWAINGQRPFSRARAIENGYGLKTIKLVVVSKGGGTSSPTTRAVLDTYFNGDVNEGGVESGVLVANQRVTAVDYSPSVIDVTVTVTGGVESAIRAALQGELQPEALRSDTSFRWSFGQGVSRNAIISIIFAADRNVTDVTLTLPATDVVLADDELPQIGTLNLTVV